MLGHLFKTQFVTALKQISLFHTFHSIYSSLKNWNLFFLHFNKRNQPVQAVLLPLAPLQTHVHVVQILFPQPLLNKNSLRDSPGIYELLCFNQFTAFKAVEIITFHHVHKVQLTKLLIKIYENGQKLVQNEKSVTISHMIFFPVASLLF